MDVEALIELLKLEPLAEEGGLYRQTWVSEDVIPKSALPGRYPADKPMGTAIYYLLTDDPDSFSALHKLPTDEVFHFYLGDPVEMLLLEPDGGNRRVLLGQDVLDDQRVQFTVPRRVWQGSYLLPGGRFALMGTTMAPGFTIDDYTMGEREDLLAVYPKEAELIRRLTRMEGGD